MGIDRRRYLLAAGGSDNYDPDTELNPYVYAYGLDGETLYVWDSCDLANASVDSVSLNISDSSLVGLVGNGFVNSYDRFVFYHKADYRIKEYYGTTQIEDDPYVQGNASSFCGGALFESPMYCGANISSGATGRYVVLYKKNYFQESFSQKAVFTTWDAVSQYIAVSADGQYAIAGGYRGYTNSFITRDYGETWSETLATSSYGDGTGDLDISNDGQYMIKSTSDGRLVYSNDYLSSFHTADREGCYGVTVSGDGSVMYCYSAGTICASEDGGITWTVRCPSIQLSTKLTCSYRGKVVLAIVSGTDLYYSLNFGRTFTRVNVDFDIGDVFIRRVPSE